VRKERVWDSSRRTLARRQERPLSSLLLLLSASLLVSLSFEEEVIDNNISDCLWMLFAPLLLIMSVLGLFLCWMTGTCVDTNAMVEEAQEEDVVVGGVDTIESTSWKRYPLLLVGEAILMTHIATRMASLLMVRQDDGYLIIVVGLGLVVCRCWLVLSFKLFARGAGDDANDNEYEYISML